MDVRLWGDEDNLCPGPRIRTTSRYCKQAHDQLPATSKVSTCEAADVKESGFIQVLAT